LLDVAGDVVVEHSDAPNELNKVTANVLKIELIDRDALPASADAEVVVHGDSAAAFQHVAAALAACREAGVSQLGVTVEIAAAGGPTNR